MKIFINPPGENWICDRLRSEFYEHLPNICTDSIYEADIVWIIAPWTVDYNHPILSTKKVISTIHHIDPCKIDKDRLSLINEKSDYLHFVSEQSYRDNKELFSKPVFCRHWWVNGFIYKPLDKTFALKSFDLPDDNFYIGSFQRDTEGHDLVSPKLSKGPDVFCDIVEKMHLQNKKIHVLLAGWRRYYVINRLKSKNIPYTYKEMLSFEELNIFYNCLDLYIVSSRCEGGPQAIPECAATKTPIISTDVGCANLFLNKKSIYNPPDFEAAKPNVNAGFKNVKNYLIPNGLSSFIEYFNKL